VYVYCLQVYSKSKKRKCRVLEQLQKVVAGVHNDPSTAKEEGFNLKLDFALSDSDSYESDFW
jgi:hypothetical protein